MTLGDFVRMVRTNLRLIFVFGSIGLLLGFIHTVRQPVIYSAASQGYVVTSGGAYDTGSGSVAMSKLPAYSAIVNTAPVAEAVIKKLGLNTYPAAIAGRFSVSASGDAPLLNITATGSTPTEAKLLADAVIEAASNEIARLDSFTRPQGAPIESAVKLIPLSQAGLPVSPTSPNYPINMALGALLGALAGLFLGFLQKQLDTKVRSMDDMEQLTQLTTLTVIPEDDQFDRVNRNGLLETASGGAAETVRQLRTNLRFVDVDNPPKSIVMTSSNPGEGKSVISANLARALALAGQPTVLIDADLRRPMQAKIFGADSTVGLTQVLAGDVELKDAVQSTDTANLHLVTAGRIPPNPSELLGSQRMQQLIRSLVDNGYMVIIDAPPLLPVTDAGLLSGIVDGTILVLAVGRTSHQQARLAARILQQVGGRALGAVLNRAPVKGIGAVVYGYGYGNYSREYYQDYDDYAPQSGDKATPSKSKRSSSSTATKSRRGSRRKATKA